MKAYSKFLGSAALAGVFAFSAVSAFAADMIDQAPEPAPVEIVPTESTGWAGPYVGAYGHWNKGKTAAPGMATRTKPEGYGGGVFGGYQLQNGSIVYGAEADVGYGNEEGRNAVIGSKTGVEGSLRARLGFAPSDRVLVYGTAGGAAGSVKATQIGAGSDKNTMLGYTVGAGVDAKLTDKVFGRVEYRYTDLGKDNFNIGGGQRVSHESSAVRLGLGVKF